MKRILILGAGFLQQFIIKRAYELGYYVIALDGNPNAVGFKYAHEAHCIDVSDAHACFDYAKTADLNGVITAATEYPVIPCSYIAEKLGLVGNSIETAKLLKNKYAVRKCFIKNNVDSIKQCFEVSTETDIEMMHVKFPVIVKPCNGSGSCAVRMVQNKGELIIACEQAINASVVNKAVVEDFTEGNEYGVESFVSNGTVYVLGISKKYMTKHPDYAELGHCIPSDLTAGLQSKLEQIATKAIKVLGIENGGVNMDVIVGSDDKISIVDVGMRMGGNLIGSHLIPIGTGIDYMGNIIRLAVGDDIQMTPIFPTSPIATKILNLSPGKAKEIPDVEPIERKYNVKILHHLKKGDVIRAYHNNLDGCGYVVATADKIDKAVENAQSAKEEFDQQIVRG